MDELHSSHTTRFSWGASSFDEICVNCGATDNALGGWGELAKPCPNQPKENQAEKVVSTS